MSSASRNTSLSPHAPSGIALSFAPHVEVLAVEERGLVALGEQWCDVYSGAMFAKLATLIDGSQRQQEILDAFEDGDREAAAAAISELQRSGVLVEGWDGDVAEDTAAWWSSQLVQPRAAAARIRDAAVHVQALGEIDVRPTIEALTDAGLRLADRGELAVVLVDNYLDDGLVDLNMQALQEAQSWMLAQLRTAEILVGPVFSPGRGPCWECLADRLRRKRAVERRLRSLAAAAEDRRVRVSGLLSQRTLGPTLVATEALRWIAGSRTELETTILSFDLRTWHSARHRVVWRPQCRSCGVPDASVHRHAAPIDIRRGRPRRSGRGLRAVPPSITLERFEHHISPITGVVNELTKRGSEYLHVYAAPKRSVRINGDRRGWQFVMGMSSSGKGTSDEGARASALCEALQVHSGHVFGDEPSREGTFEELGNAAVHPNEYMQFSDRQFDERDRWNEQELWSRLVPERFDPCDRIAWSPVWSLTHRQERLLPTALCYLGAGADVPGSRYCVAVTNGTAAGNTIEEAILHGLLELIERDHVALWWYNRTRAPAVDLESIDDPWLSQLRDHASRQGRELWALDLTADLGIPVAICVVASADGSGMGMGFGAYPDLRGAVIRAATELAQLGLGSTVAMDQRLHFVRPDPQSLPRACSSETHFSGDLIGALDRCREAVERQGMELLVLDQTRPDIGLPVVRVLVPGLRHYWPRFGAGRLYDVPVSLGRLERPYKEQELNPVLW
jgi:bacteriocin biosynthesis cyclodehydratase domain-containing protein